MSLRGALTKLPRECQTKSLRGVINLSKDNNDPTSLKAPIKLSLVLMSYQINVSHVMKNTDRHSRLCVKDAKCRMREREPSQIKMKTIINLLQKNKSRDKFKKMELKYVPVSSILYKVAKYFETSIGK